MSPLGRGSDPRLRFDTADMYCCACAALGTPTDAADMGGGWWLVAWLTVHAPECAGARAPERAYLLNADAFALGDVDLPGLPGGRP